MALVVVVILWVFLVVHLLRVEAVRTTVLLLVGYNFLVKLFPVALVLLQFGLQHFFLLFQQSQPVLEVLLGQDLVHCRLQNSRKASL